MSHQHDQNRPDDTTPVVDSHILIVDRDEAAREALHKLLSAAGYETVAVGDAITARASCRDAAPALVIMETHSGDEADFVLMRWFLSEHQLPVIVIEETPCSDGIRQAVRLGGHGFILKPISEPELIAAVEIATMRHRQWRELRLRNEEMTQALHTNRQISTAVGILMERHRLTDTEAFEHLRSKARASQRKVEDLARDLVDATCDLNLPAGNSPDFSRRDSRGRD